MVALRCPIPQTKSWPILFKYCPSFLGHDSQGDDDDNDDDDIEIDDDDDGDDYDEYDGVEIYDDDDDQKLLQFI